MIDQSRANLYSEIIMAIDNQIEVHDIYLAAYLKIAGCTLEGRRKQGVRWFFQFINPAGSILQLREDYYSGKGQVSAVKFAQEIQNMKQLLFE